jgi:hypothetical protein
MSLKMRLVTALAAILVAGSAAATDDFAVPQTVNLPAYDFKGRTVDIVGIKPGMKAEEAMAVLKERFPGEKIGGMTSSIGNRTVSSGSYDSLYHMWKREKEEVNVYMTSPSSGNAVFHASRALDFWNAEDQPDFEKTIAAFVAKYGEPSKREEVLPDPKYVNKTSKTVTLMWYLGGNGKCELTQFDNITGKLSDICNTTMHKTGPSVKDYIYNPARAEVYAKTAKAGSDLVLVAKMSNHDGSERISRMTVSFTDLKRRALTAEADIALINAEQAKFDSVKVGAPDL